MAKLYNSRAGEETGLPLHFLVGFPQIYGGKILGSGPLTDPARNDSTKKLRIWRKIKMLKWGPTSLLGDVKKWNFP